MAQSQLKLTNKDLDNPSRPSAPTSRIYTNRDIEKHLPPSDFVPNEELVDFDAETPNIQNEELIDFDSEIPKPNPQVVPENAPDTWMEGFKQSVLGGEALDVGMQGAKGFLKGSILDIPETAWNIAKSAGSTFLDKMRGDSSGLELDDPGMSIDFSKAGTPEGAEQFGREVGQITGQPLATYGIAKATPSVIRGSGAIAENAGRLMNKHTPISAATGAVVGGTMGGFPGAVLGTMRPSTAILRAIERPVGRGIENVAKRMRGFGKVKTIDGKIVEAPDDFPIKEGEIIPDEVILPKELPPSKTSFYGKEKNPEVRVTPSPNERLALPESKTFHYGDEGLIEGQNIAPSVKPKIRLNKDNTYTNLETGEVFGMDGKPVPLSKTSIKEQPTITKLKGKPVDKNSPFFKKNRKW